MNDPIVDAARDILDDSLSELRKAVDGVDRERLNARPAPGTNPLAVLVTHALASTRSWLSLAMGASHPDRDRPAEFRTIVEEPAAFMAWVDGESAACRALLEDGDGFDAARVDTPTWRTEEPEEPVTAAWALLHAVEHLREHVGHAQLTRQLVEPR